MAFTDLQKEVNRYSNDQDVGFPPIACDGVPGPQTFSATVLALNAVGLSSPDQDLASQANQLLLTLNSVSDLTSQAQGLQQFLNAAAATMFVGNTGVQGLPYVTCGTGASTSPKQIVKPRAAAGAAALTAAQSKSGMSAGLFGLGLPDWAVYLGGGLAALGGIWLLVKNKR